MANFNTYAQFLLSWEGGYVNDKDDSGGATMCGVTIAAWTSYCRQHGMRATTQTLRSMTKEQWSEIMKNGYWDAVWGDHIHSLSIASMMADWAINSGPKRVVKYVQRILPGISVDGIMGPKTLNRINAMKPSVLFAEIRKARLNYYAGLAEKDESKKKFLEGWKNRVNAMQFGVLVCNDKKHTKITWSES